MLEGELGTLVAMLAEILPKTEDVSYELRSRSLLLEELSSRVKKKLLNFKC